MHLLSDSPIRAVMQDKWGLKHVAQGIYEGLPTVDDLPITIGIFGSWGSGKTSLLRLIEDLAKGDPRYRTVWFNAWKYQNRQEVWPALVQTVLSDLAKEEPSRVVRKKIFLLARAAGQVFAGRVLQLLTHGIVSAKDFDSLVSKIQALQIPGRVSADSNPEHGAGTMLQVRPQMARLTRQGHVNGRTDNRRHRRKYRGGPRAKVEQPLRLRASLAARRIDACIASWRGGHRTRLVAPR